MSSATMDPPTNLPPMPKPNKQKKVMQAGTGFLLGGAAAAAFIATTIGSLWLLDTGSAVTSVLSVLVITESVVAFGCWLAIMMVDPGTVKRSSETTEPMPAKIVSHLASGEPMDSLPMLVVEDGEIFCTQCLVWRRKTSLKDFTTVAHWTCCVPRRRYVELCGHHCEICNRCVPDFHGHSNMLGTCISNRNIYFLAVLLFMGGLGFMTALSSVFIVFFQRDK
eukprot:s1182_g3.t1